MRAKRGREILKLSTSCNFTPVFAQRSASPGYGKLVDPNGEVNEDARLRDADCELAPQQDVASCAVSLWVGADRSESEHGAEESVEGEGHAHAYLGVVAGQELAGEGGHEEGADVGEGTKKTLGGGGFG